MNDHAVVGSLFNPATAKHQNQPLEFWLAQHLNPGVACELKVINHPDGRLVLLEVPAATVSPVEFNGTAFIRIGRATPRLSSHPERLRALWDKLRPYVGKVALPHSSYYLSRSSANLTM